jgi:hypothetical protein
MRLLPYPLCFTRYGRTKLGNRPTVWISYRISIKADKAVVVYTQSAVRPGGAPVDRAVASSLGRYNNEYFLLWRYMEQRNRPGGRLFFSSSFFEVVVKRVSDHLAHTPLLSCQLFLQGEFFQCPQLIFPPFKAPPDKNPLTGRAVIRSVDRLAVRSGGR